MDFNAINWLGAAIGAFVFFALGAVWYGPLFGARWRKLVGIPEGAPQQSPPPKTLVTGFIVDLIAVATMASAFPQDIDWIGGLLGGLAVGTFIAGTTLTTQYLFEIRPTRLLVINVGYNAVGFGLAGLLVAAFQ